MRDSVGNRRGSARRFLPVPCMDRRNARAPAAGLHCRVNRSTLARLCRAGCITPGSPRRGLHRDLAGVGVRAAPGVMIVPLERAFGWDVSTISAAISINIILMGATGPFITGFMDVVGLKRTILLCLTLLAAGTGLSIFMTEPWQLFLTWGVMVGIGSGAGAVGITAAVANRWFAKHNGLAMGLLFSAAAAGQLVFLPVLALLAERFGWQAVALTVTLAIAAVVPALPCCSRNRRPRSGSDRTAQPRCCARRRLRATRFRSR